MDYKRLGQSGVKVSRICLGTAFRSRLFSQNFDYAACERIVHRALDLGINFIDTANYYSFGRSEEVVGNALRGKRDDVVLATKVFSHIKENPGPNDAGLSRFHILREVERSLTRLQTDHIDVYWLHSPDGNTPVAETLRAMDDLVRSGKVRYIGCCNHHAWQVLEGLWTSDARKLHAFVAVQNSYSLLWRTEMEAELIPACRKFGLGAVTYSPLAIGLLNGQFRMGKPPVKGSPWSENPHYRERFPKVMNEKADAVVQALIDIGAARGKTPSQVAIAWVLANPDITAIITGPDSPEHVEDVMGAIGWQLEPDELEHLNTLSMPELGSRFS